VFRGKGGVSTGRLFTAVNRPLQNGKEQYEQSTTKRKMYNPSINIELMREMEILAAQLDVRQNDILEEAIQDLLEKYKDQEPARVISNRI